MKGSFIVTSVSAKLLSWDDPKTRRNPVALRCIPVISGSKLILSTYILVSRFGIRKSTYPVSDRLSGRRRGDRGRGDEVGLFISVLASVQPKIICGISCNYLI